MAKKSIAALIVGVNAYSRPNQLRGCVPDALALRGLLMKQRGLDPRNAQLLLDKEATKKNILWGLHWLASQSAAVSLFAFSGHGTRVRDLDGDEYDTPFDQAICPVDYRRAGLILDDDLGLVFSTFPPDTKIIYHADACYSAKSTRGLLDYALYGQQRDRSIAPGLVGAASRAQTYERAEMREIFGFKRRGALPARNVLLISGCREYETSADAPLGNSWRGAMSYFVEQAFREIGPGASYRAVVNEARRRLAANGFPQIPQLEGPSEWMDFPLYT
jgi:hypothetical protein